MILTIEEMKRLLPIVLTLLVLYCARQVDTLCSCESSWLSKNGFRYKRFCNATFDDAEKHCQRLGGHLASIHSNAENDIVRSMSEIYQNYTTYSDFTWIGLRLIGGKWKWTDGTPLDFTKWSRSEPNNYMGLKEECVELYTGQLSTWAKNTGDYEWNDVNCQKKMLFFVCKVKGKARRQ